MQTHQPSPFEAGVRIFENLGSFLCCLYLL